MMCSKFLNSTFFLIAALSSAFFISGCENSQKNIDVWTKRVVMREEATGVEALFSQDGVMKAKLLAPKMYRVFGDTVYTHFPDSLHCDFYDDSTQIETRLDSKQGKYFENYNKVYLWDSVLVVNRSGDTLRCLDLWWDQNTKLFTTDKKAIYHGIGKQVNGTIGLTATQDLSSIIFHHPIGTIEVSDSGFPK